MQKGKSRKKNLPYWKTISQIFFQLQNSRYIAEIKSRTIKQAEPLLTLPSLLVIDSCSGLKVFSEPQKSHEINHIKGIRPVVRNYCNFLSKGVGFK
jgi:hypothetical protein